MLRTALLLFASAVIGLNLFSADAQNLTIAVIPKGTTHEFWKAIHAGALAAAADASASGRTVKIIWKGPLKEDDRSAQIDVVQNFIGAGVSGIVLAPLDAKALAAPVAQATGAGIPVVIIDSALESDQQTSFIATDNHAGGKLAGERLAKQLHGTGKVIMMRYAVGSASTEAREAGFLEAMAANPGITVLSSDQHAGATRESALAVAQNLLNRYGTQVTGIFTPNESSTAGMALALNDAGLSGKVTLDGFDLSPVLIEALKAGTIDALVAQDPYHMGYLGVKAMIDHLGGVKVPAHTDTPLCLVTADNLASPEVQTLLAPGASATAPAAK